MPNASLASGEGVRCFEDIEVGETHHAGPYEVTRNELVAFASEYDPQPFHLDDKAAQASLLGGLAASGWHTAAIGMSLLHRGFLYSVSSSASPGIDELRWIKPVHPGDRLRMMLTVAAKKPPAAEDDHGFVELMLRLTNTLDEMVMSQRFTIRVQRRNRFAVVAATAPAQSRCVAASATAMPDVALTAAFDDLAVGSESILGDQLFTAEMIRDFATLYDPQPFRFCGGAAYPNQSGESSASGWHTAALWMKHYIGAREASAAARRDRREAVTVVGPSPGLTNLRWLRPVRAGETLRFKIKVTGKRIAGLLGWGLVFTEGSGMAADGELAFAFNGKLLWPLEAGSGLG